MAFLYCLARLGMLRPDDAPALGLRVFPQYLDLMRKVQTTYWCAAPASKAEHSTDQLGLMVQHSMHRMLTGSQAMLLCASLEHQCLLEPHRFSILALRLCCLATQGLCFQPDH